MAPRIILIHGPPACGKLTTAQALAAQRGSVILHNHLTFNLAQALFEIDDPRLQALHRELRLVMLRHALAAGIPEIIMTMVYAEPDSVGVVAEFNTLLEAYGGTLYPCYLRCSTRALLSRVTEAGRAAYGKLQSPERLTELLATHDYRPIPDPRTFELDNDEQSPDTIARKIAAKIAERIDRTP